MLRRARTILLSVGVALVVAGQPAWSLPAEAPAPARAAAVPVERLEVTTTQVASGLRRPVALAVPDDGTGRLLIAEKAGTVRTYHPDSGLAAQPLLDISDRVDTSGNERGLLGIATSPGFAADHRLYAAYTSLPDGAVTLSRFTLGAGDPAGSEEVLLSQPHSEYDNHNGGHVSFGPDGHLYLAIGDGGHTADPFDSGQDLGTLLGKILRLDVSRRCGDLAYCVPEDNPFTGTPGARGEIWSYGLRNPWKYTFDPADGSQWIADVGQGSFEEVNHVPAGTGGHNFGWSCREGPAPFDEAQCRPGAEYVDPVFSYPSTEGCAVIGGQVYRGDRYAELAGGTYLAADFCTATVWGVRPSGDGTYDSAPIGTFPIQVTAFAADDSGELYVVNDLPGQLHRVGFQEARPAARCTVRYQVDSDWGTGFTASVTVTNIGDTPLEGWELGWDFPAGQRVADAWNAGVTQQDTTVSARGAAWNRDLAAGGTVSFGFRATRGETNAAPDEFVLNGGTCDRAGG
ncbi:glucose/arabinose dehydrogenase [Prauserella shujinwangii]|uniref:Glucose/arabinose dehydrogenase n=1 Tax=Prauserella shujinwangii TaxID=1453103 RepID=A0A2T0M2E1_9PSEU|nr:PQQ-dependent sugar dehydrogenase [Prauserella shujinwangii]PRX50921.1 glucose/arabinose dehydrogenase [Prauserella shujinwangii]